MSRPKKVLPVVGQAPPGSSAAHLAPTSSEQVEGAERTVVRVEGMDCASCAATIERRGSPGFVGRW